MTDPSRFQVNWKSSFLFSPRDNSLSLQDLKMDKAPPSNGPSSLLPHLFPPPYQQEQQHCDRTSTSQLFAPFDTDTVMDITLKDDYDLDELSALLSRQLLQEVDAEFVPSNNSNAYSLTYTQSESTTAVMAVTGSPWFLDDDEKTNNSQSPSFSDSTAFTLLSPPLSQKQHHQDSNSTNLTFDQNNNGCSSDSTTSSSTVATITTTAASPAWWDRFGPYGNDSEFDPTLSFYQGEDDGDLCFTAATIDPILNSSDSNNSNNSNTMISSPSPGDDGSNNTAALTELMKLFKGLDEKELGETFAAFDYDTERTIEALLPTRAISFTTTTTTTATTTAMENPYQQSVSTFGAPKKHQVCRHYLAGECYRKHCRFAHDLKVKPCKFWIQGSCLKGDTCEFAHSLDCLKPPSSPDITTTINSRPPSDHQYREYEEMEHQYHRTPPTMADFTISVVKSNRRSRKSHNKKSLKK